MRRHTPNRPGTRRRCRRGSTLVEFAMMASLYFTFVFGIVEFTWIATARNSLLNGAARGARLAAVGGTVADIREQVRAGSKYQLADSYLSIQYNSTDDGSGSWQTVTDDANSGSPPIANAVPTGRPVRVRVVAWPYPLLAGRMFAWMPNVSGGRLPLTVTIENRRE